MQTATLSHTSKNTPAKASSLKVQKWIYLLALSLIWGSSYILIKKGLQGFNYLEGATIRLVAAGVVALPMGLLYIHKIPKNKYAWVLISSLLSTFIPSYLFTMSQQHIQSSLAGMLVALTPVFTFVVSVFFFRKSLLKSQVTGIVLGFIGTVVLSFATSSNAQLSFNVHGLWIVLATLCYGFNINLVKRYLSDVNAVHMSMVSVSVNGIMAFFFVAAPNYSGFELSGTTLYPLLALVTLGIIGTALAQLIHNRLIVISSPVFASACTYLIPVVAVAWGILDHEIIYVLHITGILAVLVSIYLIKREQ